MQGKVLLAVVLVAAVSVVLYLRSMGSRCGEKRCEDGQYCYEVKRGGELDDLDDRSQCEQLPESCDVCRCLDLPEGHHCERNVWGYIHVTADLE